MFNPLAIITIVLFIPLLAACTPAPTYTAENLIEDLKTAGAEVEPGGMDEGQIFSVPTQLLTVNGAYVQFFEFASAAQAEKAAAGVSTDGGEVARPDPENPGYTIIMYPDWIATPHFFRREGLVVLYLGDSLSILRALEAVMGSQFAGGPIPEEGALPTQYKHNWLLPAPPSSRPGDARLPTLWFGADGSEAVLGTASAFSYQDKVSGLNMHGDPAIPSGSHVVNANLAPDQSGVIIIAAEYGTIHSIEVWIRPWREALENFALFEGKRIQGGSDPEGDIFIHTLTTLGTTEDSLLVVHIQFDNRRENGDAFYIWRLNASSP